MKSLYEIQKKFGNAIRGESIADFSDSIIPGGRLSPDSCLNVYRDGYLARLTSALGETFETVWRVLGDENFFNLSKEYIKNYTSVSYNLSDYGEHFPEFVGIHYSEYPYLVSLAKFERAFKEVFHSRIDPAYTFLEEDLKNPENLTLVFSESAILLSYPHSVFSLWNARNQNDFVLQSDDLLNKPENYLLYKNDLAIYCEILNDNEFRILKSLFAGDTISSAVSELADQPEIDENFFSELFSRIMQMGIICGIRLK
jgi:hypothetical protein